jgi:predicted transcriptional regulator
MNINEELNLTDAELVFCQAYLKHNCDPANTAKTLNITKSCVERYLSNKNVHDYVQQHLIALRDSMFCTTHERKKILWDASRKCFEEMQESNFEPSYAKSLQLLIQEINKMDGSYTPVEVRNTHTFLERLQVTADEIRSE